MSIFTEFTIPKGWKRGDQLHVKPADRLTRGAVFHCPRLDDPEFDPNAIASLKFDYVESADVEKWMAWWRVSGATSMNLYLISQDHNDACDTYDSAVVVAPDEETARLMKPDSALGLVTWAAPEHVKVELIGVAREGLKGVVCASFNAG